MEEWITALKETISTRERLWSGTATELHDLLSGRHRWQATSHARPTYCNICKDTLSGVTSHGLSCEICKWKVHKRCASKVINNCKWTTLASVGKEIIEDKDGNIYMPHQWMEGNLPVASKCAVCEKTCGSVLRLLDWRCLWCKSTVHTACRPNFPVQCNLGPSKVSVVPPTALHSVGSDDAWEAVRPQGCSPLLVFVNSKSGDNQGVKFLKRFKQLLNPAQVFDLMASGPQLGLQLFKRFDPFRVLVCSGDGSVGWVLSEIDKLNITKQCQVGVLPLGTGNDLARVLGWGASCDDDTNLAHILDKYEKATTKILDRWSIMTFERSISVSNEERIHLDSTLPAMADYENSVVSHLSNILESEDHSSILSSAKVLCETVKDFIMRAGEISLSQGDDELNLKCTVLREKLDQMLNSLLEEGLELDEEKLEKYTTEKAEKDNEIMEERGRSKLPTQEHLKMRANSLKRAVRQLIEHSERIVDEQNMARSSGNHQDSLIREKSENTLLEPIGRTEFLSISPLPTIRRDSNCSTSDITLENLPVPTEFADSRRPSASRISSPYTSYIIHSASGHFFAEWVVPDAYDSSERIQVVVNIEQQKDPDPEEAVTRVAEIDESNQDNENEDNDSSQQEKLKGKEDKPSTFLDVVQFQIQGSNTNLRGSTDGMYLTDFQESHRKSLALSETDDEELVRFHRFASRGSVQSQIQPPQVIVDPPSPTGEDTPTRRFSYDCCRKLSAASPCSLMKPDSPDTGKAVPEKRLPIINPLVRLPTWPNISGSGIVGKVLLANADALCAAAVPLMDPLETLSEGFREKCVMNNYFGIGIDAKISLDFHQKREEHPEKCRSRAKNYMWYGVLGSKEWLQKTYKNLEQRVQLECDGQRIPLPSLQGIVILNIPSFMGGTNFWGGTKEGEVFLAPSVDDQILEVVAVFGSVQMAASRLINLQHHRIAQCHTVQINITGDEGVPVQVDGEAWIQPPGMIRIIHKNKMRMLCRNRALETSLKSWQEKQKQSKIRPSHSLSQSEMQILLSFIEATTTLVKCVKLLIIRHPSIEAEIYDLADRTSSNLEKVHPSGKIQQGPELRVLLTSLVSSARELHEEACMLLKEKAQSLKLAPELESQLNYALTSMENELRKCHVSESGQALVYLHQLSDQERKSKSGKLSWLKFRREKCDKGDIPKGMSREVSSWGVQEVGAWLDSIQLGEYAEAFARHDVRGREVITLTRRDLRDLGVTKVGHVKRLLHAVKELQSSA
ncbi:diacylglycerol kinase eta isoform X4 [Cimex lectularius]|uniref:Diacylglycerol kinase n=1 Tax=Cimex lectularius TaxID=79782 RepID=A0A8I6S2N4_CIMLE|nr:diacylglycerol kinase eta isoform X4 [Cimex lectularius]